MGQFANAILAQMDAALLSQYQSGCDQNEINGTMYEAIVSLLRELTSPAWVVEEAEKNRYESFTQNRYLSLLYRFIIVMHITDITVFSWPRVSIYGLFVTFVVNFEILWCNEECGIVPQYILASFSAWLAQIHYIHPNSVLPKRIR